MRELAVPARCFTKCDAQHGWWCGILGWKKSIGKEPPSPIVEEEEEEVAPRNLLFVPDTTHDAYGTRTA
jgi:hypothetical protein